MAYGIGVVKIRCLPPKPDDRLEGAVGADLEALLTDDLAQASRHVIAVQRDDAALMRVDPLDGRILPIVRHGEDTAGIGAEQEFWAEIRHDPG